MGIIRDDDDDEKNGKDSFLNSRLQNPLVAELEKLANEVPILIDRLHNEYNKYFGGAERQPPIKLREQLDKTSDRLRTIMKQSTNLGTSLRVQNAVNKYNQYTAMWDKRMEKFERTG